MPEMQLLIDSLGQLLVALARVGGAVLAAFVANWALVLWLAFWLFLARWSDIRRELNRGAWVAAALLYVLVSLTWGLCSESQYMIAGWSWPSILEKFLLSAAWVAVAFVCGAIQDLWGWAPAEVEIAGPPAGDEAAAGHGAAAHGHGHH